MIRKIATIFGLALLVASSVFAQTPGYTSPQSELPWNQYVPSRIPDGYQTIIGLSGTTVGIYPSSGLNSASINVPLPFPFYFLGTTLPAGSNMSIAQPGYLSLNGGTTQTWTYPAIVYQIGTGTYNYYDKIISPYWSDILPSGTNLTDGGVFYRTDGTTPNRVMTIEWRCTGQSYGPGNPGNFQCKLFEATGTIEFHYGPNSSDR
jgi:hypothetical protein